MVATSDELVNQIKNAVSGDIIVLKSGTFKVSESIVIDKEITITSSNSKKKSKIEFTAAETAFEMHPKGNLILKDVVLSGNKSQNAFTTLDKNMSKAYNLHIENTEITNFKNVLEVSKGSFSDNVVVTNSLITNCENGFLLNKETNDGGDYNAEFVTFTNSKFDGIQGVVLDYYRGGYDESTIGGNLKLEGNIFTNCGKDQAEHILIKNRGIVFVTIANNTFKDNAVKTIAVLWGEKGQEPINNKITNSGKIEIVQNLEMKLMY